jgi:RNA-binding protein
MPLTNEQKKQYKSIGHHLKPVLIVSENGLTEGVQAELERALSDHELIKVQLRLTERDERKAVTDELCRLGNCELVQSIGKMALVNRKNPKANKQISNNHRYKARARIDTEPLTAPARGRTEAPVAARIARSPGN